MDKFRIDKERVKINYLVGKNRYYLLTGKTGCPSAEFKCRGSRLIVEDLRLSSADPD